MYTLKEFMHDISDVTNVNMALTLIENGFPMATAGPQHTRKILCIAEQKVLSLIRAGTVPDIALREEIGRAHV